MIDLAGCLSDRGGDLGERVTELTRAHALIWRGCPAHPAPPGRVYSSSEKAMTERDLGAVVRRIAAEARAASSAPPSPLPPDRLEALAASLRDELMPIVGRLDLPLTSVYDDRFVASTQAFLRAARDFDPALHIDSAYQALRNVWIMNTLQSHLGVEVEHTDAVFGYSMIYPYLDNLLDDDRLDAGFKAGCLLKLRDWLEGIPAPAAAPLEDRLRGLVGRIEARFPRPEHPRVFQSLLAIYNAQVRSLRQQHAESAGPAGDLLEITIEKGGTSVLADGYLASGHLSPLQEEFCFGFGACLQLTDDIQDAAEDARRGRRTLFSASPRGRLEPLVDRLDHFMAAVLERSLPGRDERSGALRETIRRGCRLLHLEAVGKHPRRFGRRCVRRAQAEFPVRFAWLKKLRHSVADAFPAGRRTLGELDPLTAAFLAMSSRALALDA